MKLVFVVKNKNNRLAHVLPGLEQFYRETEIGSVHFTYTKRQRHAIELAREATETGCDYLVAIGGDGTLHEVINGVIHSNIPQSNYPVIGLRPYGSANDFARTARLSPSFEELDKLIRSKSIQEIDLGKIELQQTGEIRYFINIAGVGLGAEVAQNIAQSSSLFGPGFNYFRHIIKGFLSYSKKEVKCSGSSWEWQGKLLQMAVAKGRYFGNAICIAPDAGLSNGEFQLAIFGDVNIWEYLKNLGNLKKGVKIKHPQVSYYTSNEVILESNEACGIEADGEYVGLLPASLSILPKAIRFLMVPEIIDNFKKQKNKSP